jgi:hypothetical protein
MSWNNEWKAIEQQIHEVDRLCTSTINTFSVKSTDPFSVVSKVIFPVCRALRERISLYKNRYITILPENAVKAIDDTLLDLVNHFSAERTSTSVEPAALLFYKETFNRLRFDFNYFVNELEGSVYRRSERAFLHLQRTLVVSEDDRRRWKKAFDDHETHIEALGSVHLLLHGIWAFKVESAKQRTDLVFQEEFTSHTYESIRVASEGLVLTEWKLVKDIDDVAAKSQEAFKQASIYGAESLAETELTRYRYLVLVSLKKLKDMPEDFEVSGVKYRHINIAIEIESPSVRSRKK